MGTGTGSSLTRRRLLAGGAGIAAIGAALGRGLLRPGTERVMAKGRDRLYAVSEEGGLRLTPLDGETLRDDAAEAAIVLGTGISSAVVASGEIEAAGLGEHEVARVLPLDGGLYVASWDPGFALRQLDPSLLDVRAERRYGEWHAFLSVRP